MLKLRFFASLRDQLECCEDKIPWQPQFTTLAVLVDTLGKRGPQWRASLTDNSLLIAVNQTMAQPSTTLQDGDEIAFFPPVTGG